MGHIFDIFLSIVDFLFIFQKVIYIRLKIMDMFGRIFDVFGRKNKRLKNENFEF